MKFEFEVVETSDPEDFTFFIIDERKRESEDFFFVVVVGISLNMLHLSP